MIFEALQFADERTPSRQFFDRVTLGELGVQIAGKQAPQRAQGLGEPWILLA